MSENNENTGGNTAEVSVDTTDENTSGKGAEGAAGSEQGTTSPESPQASADSDAAGAAGIGETEEDAAAESSVPASGTDPFAVPPSPTSVLFHAPDFSAVVAPTADAEDDDRDEDEESEGTRGRRSRRRRRQRGGEEAGADNAGSDEETEEAVSSRRRRRRRRGEADLELAGGSDEDPPGTVTRVRAPRAAEAPPSNKVTSVKGSTRLEAKRQRRRESRDSGRRRQGITEAEFLARRESVDRKMIVRQGEGRIQIAVLEDGILAEHFVSKTQQDSLIGNVYVGKVQNVLPSMEAAFVDIGRGRNAVLYAGEVNWDAANLDGKPRRIENALKSGDSVVVQVTKDPVGHKGARLTSQVSLPGRYLVYVPGGSMTGISRKLPDVERNRLKKILKDHLPENAGVIVRTAAEGASEEELMNDINRLRAQWEDIEGKSKSTKTLPPELLYSEPDLTIKVVRDVFNEDFTELIVQGDEAWDTIEAYVTYVAPDLLERLQKWTKDEDIFSAHRIDEQITKALDRKVFLPSGGSLVIDRTEAMTVVDVNTGKFTGSGGNLEETVTKNNLEAAEEIVRQLRLRDIGGIIVIDFIDMVLESNRDLVLRRLIECLGRDRTKHQVAEVTSLGLVQMTRKRMGTGLLEVFSEPCEHCAGRGVITHEEPVDQRRAHNAQGEPLQERPGRRRKGKQDKPAEKQEQHAAPAATESDAEREAKASAAREALAKVAAAAHAAHEHEHENPEPGKGGTEPASGQSAAEADSEAVLDIAGEKVKLPRGRKARRRASTPAPDLTLESLTAAFGVDGEPEASADSAQVPEPARREANPSTAEKSEPARPSRRGGRRATSAQGAPEKAAAGASTPTKPTTGGGASVEEEQAQQPTQAPAASASPAPAPRGRRRGGRVATSAQGSGETPIERGGPVEATGTAYRAEAPAGRPDSSREAGAGPGPTILGVGVPASEL
ncbi:Rne/Rng family ribonuclease [Zhihengliuella sp.]|uniref:ribonuclease E/G n=1 Tax=Zhihengliuella sp. TaxID=1954483 RepID=UPI00281262DA|nr:Rne/Rng family ribonuclease [Zhihengliuella sp.]